MVEFTISDVYLLYCHSSHIVNQSSLVSLSPHVQFMYTKWLVTHVPLLSTMMSSAWTQITTFMEGLFAGILHRLLCPLYKRTVANHPSLV